MKFKTIFPNVNIVRCFGVGDTIHYNPTKQSSVIDRYDTNVIRKPNEMYLEKYYQDRKTEIENYFQQPYHSVTTKDLYQYFFRLHQKNESMIKETKWKKKIRIGILGENGGIIKSWGCIIGYQPAASKLSSSLSNVAVFDMNDYSENGDNQEFVEE